MALSTKAKQDDLDTLVNTKANVGDSYLKVETYSNTEIDEKINSLPVLFQCVFSQPDNFPISTTAVMIPFSNTTITSPYISLSSDPTVINIINGGYYRITTKMCCLYGNTTDNRLEINYIVNGAEQISSFPYFTTSIHTCSQQVDEVIIFENNDTLSLQMLTTIGNFNLTTYGAVPQVTVTLVKLKDLN